MSDSSRRKYRPKLVLLEPKHEELILTEARRRDPEYDMRPKTRTRIQNIIVRDFFDFAHEHYELFLTWIATRGTIA